MLGLGNSITHATRLPGGLIFTYNSDFTSNIDSWTQYSVEGDAWTFQAGQNPPGQSGNDWLKVTVTDTQTNMSGIKRNILSSINESVGDYLTFQYKIYLYHDGSTDHWEGTDEVSTYNFVGTFNPNPAAAQDVALNTVATVGPHTLGPDSDGSYGDDLHITFAVSSDNPQAGAVFYIKDVELKLYTS